MPGLLLRACQLTLKSPAMRNAPCAIISGGGGMANLRGVRAPLVAFWLTPDTLRHGFDAVRIGMTASEVEGSAWHTQIGDVSSLRDADSWRGHLSSRTER